MDNELKAFFKETTNAESTDEVFVSDRFKDSEGKPIKFKIRSVTQEKNDEISRSCERKVKGQYGQYRVETDQKLYMVKMIIECTIFPDFKNAELQSNYGVVGQPEKLIKKMLTPGEYAKLSLAIQSINGFDEDPNELIEEAKN